MRKTTHLTLSAAFLVLAANIPFAGSSVATPEIPVPPPPAVDLHVRVVPEGPPVLRPEVVIPSPGPNFVWVKGYWHHNGTAWAWNEGRWVAPPVPHARWIVARYEKVPGGIRYVPGHWSHEHVILK